MEEYRYPKIDQVILFGGGSTLIEFAKSLIKKGLQVSVFTAPRHAEEVLVEGGKAFSELVSELGITLEVTEDINRCDELRTIITGTTMGMGFGEAWSFSADLINAFYKGCLLDFMGIPLPRYRGGAHYSWMIQRGERTSGFCMQLINEDMVQGEFDSGAIIYSEPFQFPNDAKTPADYFAAAEPAQHDFLVRFIEKVLNGDLFRGHLPDETQSLFFPRLNTAMHGWIDWRWSGEQIAQFIDSFDRPYPGARTLWNDHVVILKSARLDDSEGRFHPFHSGLVVRKLEDHTGYAPNQFAVATTDGLLVVDCDVDHRTEIKDQIKVGDRLYTPEDRLLGSKIDRIQYGVNAKPLLKNDQSQTHGKSIRRDNVANINEFRLSGNKLLIRPVTIEDCNDKYLSWLQDEEVNRYLETRWNEQTHESIVDFVKAMINSENQFLLAIVDKSRNQHIGNIKLGPINFHHKSAEISYFIGDKSYWGKGCATEAIKLVTEFAFEKFNLEYLLAGVYSKNIGSIKALNKVGYTEQGRLENQLVGPNGREDHLFYGMYKGSTKRGSKSQKISKSVSRDIA